MAAATESTASPRAIPRIGALDTARGIALLAMATYHFSWDLEFFGYLDAGTTGHGLFKIYARGIATTFLFLAGVSLVLGHTPTIRWHAAFRRFCMIAAAAVAISAATAIAMPDGLIFFGILHCIAAASLIGLLFLRLPSLLTLLVAAAAFAAPFYLRSGFFDVPWLWWVGLSENLPRSNDYVPLLPWLAPFLVGIIVARVALARGWLTALAGVHRGTNLLAKAGRHSLVIYLVHQPLLLAIAYGLSLVVPPALPDPVAKYRSDCQQACVAQQDAAICARFCSCTLDALMQQNLFAALQSGAIQVDKDDRIQTIASQCTAVSK